jgi:hypothetical protein
VEAADGLAVIGESCCAPETTKTATLHESLSKLLSEYDVNAAAASVKVYAIKPTPATASPCCGPTCCVPAKAV